MIDAKIVSPDALLFEGEVSEIYARSTEGEIGILPGHQPALLLLAPAPLELVTADGSRLTFAVRSGFLQFADNQLTVLAEAAEQVGDKAGALDVVRGYDIADDELGAQAPG